MLSSVIPEPLIYRFTFVGPEGELQDGMSYRSELYRQVALFSAEQYLHARALMLDLAQYGSRAVITRSQANYSVWMSLRLQNDANSQLKPLSLT